MRVVSLSTTEICEITRLKIFRVRIPKTRFLPDNDSDILISEIAEFRSHTYQKDLDYGQMEPLRYGMIPDLFPKSNPSLPTDVYEDLSEVKDEDVYFSIGQDRLGNKWTMPESASKPHDYSNNIPRGTVKPRLVQKSLNLDNAQARTEKSSVSKLKRSQSESIGVKSLPQVRSTEDIAKLNIDQVGGYLEKLKLDSYVPLFKEHMVDGVVLRDLDKEILVSDFGLKAVEAIKLSHFIKEGHLPK